VRVPIFSSVQDAHPQAPLHSRFPSLPNQGIGAELIAARWKLDRDALDEFSARSHRRAAEAAASGAFASEIVPVALPDGSAHTEDETVRAATSADRLGGLKPSFWTAGMGENHPHVARSITPVD